MVTKATADKYNLKSIADLAAVANKLTLGAPAGVPDPGRRHSGPARRIYGVTFKTYKKLDAGGPLTENALKNGQIDAGDIFTTDPLIAKNGWVVLADPKSLYTAQNVLPLINSSKASANVKTRAERGLGQADHRRPGAAQREGALDKQDPDAVAKAWLTQAGLG